MKLKRYVHIALFAALITLYSCFSMVGEEVMIADKKLKDGSIIQLDYRGGGATAPDVIWVSKTNNNGKILISKFRWREKGYTTEISQTTDSAINIKFTDTSVLFGHITTFNISLRDTIHHNDGSPYANPQKNSN